MTFKAKPHTACDFYKIGHKAMYEKGTEVIYSNFTPRTSKLATKLSEVFENKVVMFGLQGFIKEFLIEAWNEGFFDKPKAVVVEEYRSRVSTSLALENVDTSHIESLHDLGYLPLQINAIEEGNLVNVKVPVFTVTNTLKEFFWLPNYIESVISSELWKPITSATTAWQYRKLLELYAEKTGSSKEFVLWQGHDFSFRGMSGLHDAAKSGVGHLLSFLGTDTIPAIDYAEDYYGAKSTFVGGSVPASEHSVMCLSGSDNELETFRRLIQDTFPTGVISVVSDSYDYWKAITEYAAQLKGVILSRPANSLGLSKVVFRPDSGDPVKIVAGYSYYEFTDEDDVYNWDTYDKLNGLDAELVKIDGKYYKHSVEYFYDSFTEIIIHQEVYEHEVKGSVECLWDIFGGTVTETGHKLLDSHVGLIYGDSITLDRANAILKQLEAKGFASGNIVFGIGSFTYQYQTRDTYGFAMKATYGEVDGVPRTIFKDPKTDTGAKKSAKGLLKVIKTSEGYELQDQQTGFDSGELVEVFKDGQLTKELTLEQIRKNLWS